MIMKTKAILLGTAALMFVLTSEKAIAQIGTPYIHDPSTIMECDGKYYTFGTGGGGYLGGPYYKIVIEGTNRALAATADAEVVTVPEFTGAPEQLWRIDQLTDGTYRIMPKEVPGTDKELVLASVGDSTPSLGEFDMNSDNSKWNFRDH